MEAIMSKLISLRLPDLLDQRVEKYALRHGLSRSGAIVALVENGLSNTSSDTDRDTATSNIESRLAMLEDVMHRDTTVIQGELLSRLEALKVGIMALNGRDTVIQDARRTVNLDPDKHYLGSLCDRGHDWQNSGQSRRAIRNKRCLSCEAEDGRQKRAAKRPQP